jgi:hypothetical protein
VAIGARDDGVGGASLERGSRMRGLLDRLATLGGTIRVAGPAGGGTTLVADVRLGAGDETAADRRPTTTIVRRTG